MIENDRRRPPARFDNVQFNRSAFRSQKNIVDFEDCIDFSLHQPSLGLRDESMRRADLLVRPSSEMLNQAGL
ncbi:MAG: hypothetical protein ACRC1K_16615, partial [Planctomycetia bacterium]